MQERRLLLAIVLSMAVVFIWQILFPPPVPVARSPRTSGADSGVLTASAGDTTNPSSGLALSPSDSGSGPRSEATTVDAVLRETAMDSRDERPRRPPTAAELDLASYSVTVAETGGLVGRILLRNYFSMRSGGDSHQTVLVSGETASVGHLGLTFDIEDRAGLAREPWVLDTAALAERVTDFRIFPRIPELPPGIEIGKRILWHDTYAAEVEVTLRNTSGRPVTFSSSRLSYPLQEIRREGSLLLHLGPDLGLNHPAPAYAEQYLVTGSFGKAGAREAAEIESSWTHSVFGLPDPSVEVEWAALENRYFALAARPEGFPVDALFTYDASRRMHLWLLLPAIEVPDGATKSFRLSLFAGPKSTELLAGFAPELEQLDGMEPSVLPRKVSIARMMVGMLAWLERYLGNWGWAIILLTVLVRLLLLPLTHVQFKSMARMQQLKPRIDELQVRYANDKERLQRELLNVYREAGVNPLGGCLPLLVQMPILIGLFIALQNAIELRGVPFILWIQDLSIPDTVFTILGIPFNPLPLFMGATMWIQQKLTPMPSADPAQQQVMMMMPILMTVLFYNFPSGLALYWSVQNVLSIAQQYYMMRVREVTTT